MYPGPQERGLQKDSGAVFQPLEATCPQGLGQESLFPRSSMWRQFQGPPWARGRALSSGRWVRTQGLGADVGTGPGPRWNSGEASLWAGPAWSPQACRAGLGSLARSMGGAASGWRALVTSRLQRKKKSANVVFRAWGRVKPGSFFSQTLQ